MARWMNAHSDPGHLHQLPSGERRFPAHPLMRDKVFPWVTQPKNKTQPHEGTRSALGLQEEHNHWYRHGAKELTSNGMQPLGTNLWHEQGTYSTGHLSPLPATSPWENTCILWGSRIPVSTTQRAR